MVKINKAISMQMIKLKKMNILRVFNESKRTILNNTVFDNIISYSA